MNCPNCHTENPEGARVCFNCGTKLALVCPQCETENPLQARFCFNCGHPFIEQLPLKTDEERRPQAAAAQRMVPNHLIPGEFADKLKNAQVNQAMQGERRVVTMLFCDVAGSTGASQQLDPEEWTEVMNGVFERMIAPIYQYEGNVARLMGDAILAFFGAPIAHEDDPQRAVLAGLDPGRPPRVRAQRDGAARRVHGGGRRSDGGGRVGRGQHGRQPSVRDWLWLRTGAVGAHYPDQ